MAKSASPRASLRRGVLKVLAEAKRSIGVMQKRWNVDGKVYQAQIVNNEGGRWRQRRVDEYPENNWLAWVQTINDLNDMIDGLTILRDQAHDVLREMGMGQNKLEPRQEYAGSHAFRPGAMDWRGNISEERCAFPDCGARESSDVHALHNSMGSQR